MIEGTKEISIAVDSDVILKKTLSELKKYSLIRLKYDNTFEMPTLLQEVIAESISDITYSSSVAAAHE